MGFRYILLCSLPMYTMMYTMHCICSADALCEGLSFVALAKLVMCGSKAIGPVAEKLQSLSFKIKCP